MRRQYTPVPQSCASVRRDLTRFLDGRGVGERVVETCVMIANELCSNVVDHVGTPFVVAVTVHGDVVRIEVSDRSAQPPVVRAHDPYATRGRGLQMVEALARAWTVITCPSGKTVVADVAAA